ncbi:trypsin-7-like [Uranotaenia lowii]|uniref:trypsin-7-like n=1 Tax=Uranotaenia lowii TaxID=190385 RepID=UPI00247A0FB3|nr:trypsin-7-like [Uranotaenia lowii]
MIRTGSSYHTRGGVVLPVERFVLHPHFEYYYRDYDCALIQLKQPFEAAIPVPLKSGRKRFRVGESCTTMGWGRTATSKTSRQMMTVKVPVVTIKTCSKVHLIMPVTKQMMCAGFAAGGPDICEGDGGGPLMCRGVQVGIASTTSGCGEADKYGVYTDITRVRMWIWNITRI